MTIFRKATIILGALCLLAMTLITCADVVMRYFFNNPIFGSGEMTQILLAVCVFSGMYAVSRDRGHVNVSLFEPFYLTHMRKAYRWLFDAFSLLGVAAVTAILGWKAYDLTQYSEETIVLQFPMLVIVGAMFLLSALSIYGAWKAATGGPRELPPHSPQNIDFE